MSAENKGREVNSQNPESTDPESTDRESADRESTESLMPLWEVFIRPRSGLNHKHVGSLHAPDEVMAVQAARDVYTRREEGNSIWVVKATHIVASDPDRAAENFDPAADKIYRHPSFYDIPDEVGHM